MSIKQSIKYRVNQWVKRTQWYDELFQDCRKLTSYNTFNTEVVNLGSTSAVCAFDYSGLPVKGANWALSHHPLMGDEAVLKNYFSYLKPQGSTVFISLCAFSALAGSYGIDEDRYYAILYPSSIPHFSYRRQRRVRTIYHHPVQQMPVGALVAEVKRLFRPAKPAVVMDEAAMEANAGMWISGWLREFSLSSFSAPLSLLNQDAVEDAARILDRIVSFCRQRGIRPVLVIPPMYHTLAEKFTPAARRMLIGDMLDKMTEKEVTFLNYMDDAQFAHRQDLFRDSFFMNPEGAREFTKRVLKDAEISIQA